MHVGYIILLFGLFLQSLKIPSSYLHLVPTSLSFSHFNFFLHFKLSSHQLPVRNTKARHLNRFLLISPSQGEAPMLKLCLRDYWFSILSSAGSFLRWFDQSILRGKALTTCTLPPNSNPSGSDGFEPCGREEWTPFVTVE